MSIIGPRPALWNQYDLIAERDKYGANDILPGSQGGHRSPVGMSYHWVVNLMVNTLKDEFLVWCKVFCDYFSILRQMG